MKGMKEMKEMKEMKKREFIFSDIYVGHSKEGKQYLYTITKKSKKRAFVKLIDKETNKMLHRQFNDGVDKIAVRCNGYKYNFINDTKDPKNTTIELVLFGVDDIYI
jgi:hypothetical protein